MDPPVGLSAENFGTYPSKESFSENSRNERTTAYSENSDDGEMELEEKREPKVLPQEFPQKLGERMNPKLGIYDTIMSEIRDLYVGEPYLMKDGINRINLSDLSKLIPTTINSTVSKKVRILLVGSAGTGKSTFVNWFVQDHVQSTECQKDANEFALVTSGKYACELNGDISVRSYDYLKSVSDRNKNFKDHLRTRVYVNRRVETKYIEFIDTPGLRDVMPDIDCDVNSIIYDLADFVDLILIFFDSSSKSMSNRILSVIREVYEKHMEKVLFLYSKIDEIRQEEDRIKLLCQATQCLASRVRIRTNIDIVPIYISGAKNGKYLFPHAMGKSEVLLVNRINFVVEEIKLLFLRKVQNDLYVLNKDCDEMSKKICDILRYDNEKRDHIYSLQRQRLKHSLIQVVIIILLTLLLFANMSNNGNSNGFLQRIMKSSENRLIVRYVNGTARLLNKWDGLYIALNAVLLFFFSLSGIMKKKFSKNINVMHYTSKETLREYLLFLKYVRDRYVLMVKAFYEMKEST